MSSPLQDVRLPVGATLDPELQDRVTLLCQQLPESLRDVVLVLSEAETSTSFDVARLVAVDALCARRESWLGCSDVHKRLLMDVMARFMSPEESAPLLRLLVRDRSAVIRRRSHNLLKRFQPDEVALPATESGQWDSTGWVRGVEPGRLQRHIQGTQRQKECGVPAIETVGELQKLLGITTQGQLGYLMRNNEDPGPYRLFNIPKRDGGQRLICAPRKRLKRVQRAILQHVLSKVPAHDAAHGFVTGRSTRSAAEPHVGKALVIKFDLKDFFPTLHVYRVVGLFASLGYALGNHRISAEDDCRSIAPMLAQLSTYSPTPYIFGAGWAPQGAPTSPAISNLVCRRLDARLQGLAESVQGNYTRYADDLTFSMDKAPEGGLGRFRWWVDQICHQEGFVVRRDKFKVIRAHQRQQVTGVVVNDCLRIPRTERRRLRAILHNCERHGVASQTKHHPEVLLDRLQGYASYIHMINPEEGQTMMARVKKLRTQSRAQEGS